MEHGAAHATIADLLWPAVNFSLFVFIMIRALRGPLREYFRERTDRLKAALEAGARARRDAEAVRAELARELANLPALRERMKADPRDQARPGLRAPPPPPDQDRADEHDARGRRGEGPAAPHRVTLGQLALC